MSEFPRSLPEIWSIGPKPAPIVGECVIGFCVVSERLEQIFTKKNSVEKIVLLEFFWSSSAFRNS